MKRTRQQGNKVTRTALLVGFLAQVLIVGCALEDGELQDADVDDEVQPRTSPGVGTGTASWTVTAGGNTLVFTMNVNDGVVSDPTLSGTPPPFSSLPLVITNGDGEKLEVTEVMIGSSRYRRYSGSFEIDIDSDSSAGSCTECICNAGLPPCQPALAWQHCNSTTTTCTQWACGSAGGGIVTIELDFTATPGAPW